VARTARPVVRGAHSSSATKSAGTFNIPLEGVKLETRLTLRGDETLEELDAIERENFLSHRETMDVLKAKARVTARQQLRADGQGGSEHMTDPAKRGNNA
jgi:hypothetical protein